MHPSSELSLTELSDSQRVVPSAHSTHLSVLGSYKGRITITKGRIEMYIID